MNKVIEYFQNAGLPISNELLKELQQFKKKKLTRGDFFVKEGKISRQLAFIVKGKIRHFYNIDGKEHTRWVSLENNFVTAFSSFLKEKPSLENLECITNCDLLVIGKKEFFRIKNDYPVINKFWVQALENEMAGYEERVFQLISKDSEKRYLHFMENYPTFIQNVPQKYIASMLGMEPRHLSRIRKNLTSKRK